MVIVSKLLPLFDAVDCLDLSGNHSMGTDGASALVEAVRNSGSKIHTVIINRVPVTSKTYKTTLEVVDTDETLIEITCSANIPTQGLDDTTSVTFSGLETVEEVVSVRNKQISQRLSEKHTLDYSGQPWLGPAEVKMISEFVIPNSSKLDRLVLCSTGNMDQQKSYTLENLQKVDRVFYTGEVSTAPKKVDDKTLRLANKHLGPTDVQLLACVFMSFRAFAQKYEILELSNNPIGFEGASSVIQMIKTSHLKTIISGRASFKLPTSLQDQAKLKCCNMELGPADAMVIASILTDKACLVKTLDLSKNNFGFGEDGTVDSEQRGWSALCIAMGTCQLEELVADQVGTIRVKDIIHLVDAECIIHGNAEHNDALFHW
jgi:hypothetical protein